MSKRLALLATSASAALLGYTLTDLAPDDGIAPWVRFTTNPRHGRAMAAGCCWRHRCGGAG